MFVHLHVHTEYSLPGGACALTELIARAREWGMPALAITDQGNLYGAVEFYRMAREAGIKAIIGCELEVRGTGPAPGTGAFTAAAPSPAEPVPQGGIFPQVGAVPVRGSPPAGPSFHLVLLAENNQGYHNLLELVTRANLESYPAPPRVSREILARHGRGLIALSGCYQGEVAQLLLAGDYPGARGAALFYQEIFGPGNFFLELQDHGLAWEKIINTGFCRLAEELGIPLVATNDVRYLEEGQAGHHGLLVAIRTGRPLNCHNPLQLPNSQYYFKSGAEMARLFGSLPGGQVRQALANTVAIAERCDADLGLGAVRLPDFQAPAGFTPESYLRYLCEEGLAKRYPAEGAPETKPGQELRSMASGPSLLRERLEYELSVICGMGFAPYFLIVRDIVEFARREGIPVGPGRGSAGGSLVAYLLGITNIDPIKHNLYFERFLNPERPDLPDIDLDVCQRRRDEILAYLFRKYGEDRVAHIGIFSTLGARGAVREAGKALNIPATIVEPIARALPHFSGRGGLAHALAALPEFRRISLDREPVRILLRGAQAVEGTVRHTSTHACGILITRDKLTGVVALERSNKGEIITQFPPEAIEALGLLKIDLLGLRNLTIIDDTLQMLRGQRAGAGEGGPPRRAEDIPLDDQETYRLFRQGETIGCFQVESPGMRVLMKKIGPRRLEDIIALLSLYRPGPWDSGMVETYIRRLHGEEGVTYPHPDLEPVLKETYGVILYQEQVMQVAHVLAGYSLGEADSLRRAITRRSPEKMALHRARFIQGATAKGYPPRLAEEVFELLAKFAGYGFNKAHSTAYAYLSYQTAYLKVHYPVEYTAALLTSQMGFYSMAVYVEEARRRGVRFLPPDINRSQSHFTVEEAPEGFSSGPPGGKAVRVGFSVIKGLGPAALAAILAAREEGPFKSLYDFCCRINLEAVTRPVIQNLIRCGAMDSLGFTRPQALASLSYFLRLARSRRRVRQSGQVTLFEGGMALEEETLDYSRAPRLPDYTMEEKLAAEKELLGIYLSGHPLDKFNKLLSGFKVVPTSQLAMLAEGSRVTVAGLIASCRRRPTKKGEYMLFLLLEDREGQVEVTLFPRVYHDYLYEISPEGIIVEGKLAFDGEEPKILAERIRGLEFRHQEWITGHVFDVLR